MPSPERTILYFDFGKLFGRYAFAAGNITLLAGAGVFDPHFHSSFDGHIQDISPAEPTIAYAYSDAGDKLTATTTMAFLVT